MLQQLRPSTARNDYLLAQRLTLACLGLVLFAASIVSVRWTLANPHIASWDQIQYITVALEDHLIHRLEGSGALRDTLFNNYRWMPPGPRLLAMPLVAIGISSDVALRLVSFVIFGLCLGVLFDACRRVSGLTIAAGATAIVAAAPVWVRGTEDFMSETALAPALVVALWCLVREIEAPRALATPPLMGAAIGIGMLARFSFAPMVIVVLGALAYRAWRTDAWPRLLAVLFVALLVAWPFYAYNGVRYLSYGQFAASWPLDQLPGRGLAYAWNYLRAVTNFVFGLPELLLLPVVLFVAARGLVGRARGVDSWAGQMDLPGRSFLAATTGLILLATVLPHILGHNQNPRYLLGALPVLALFLATGVGPRIALLMSGVSAVQAIIMLGFMADGPYAMDTGNVADRIGLASVSWRTNTICNFGQVVKAASALAARPVVKFYGVSDAVNHVQIEQAFLRAGILAVVVAPDLSRPEAADPSQINADIVLVLDPADPARRKWTHAFVANPDAHQEAILAKFAGSAAFVHSEAQVGGVPALCAMTVFVRKAASDTVKTRLQTQDAIQ